MQDKYIVIHNPVADCSIVMDKIKKLEKDKKYKDVYIDGILAYCYCKCTQKKCEDFRLDCDEDVQKCLEIISITKAKEQLPSIG